MGYSAHTTGDTGEPVTHATTRTVYLIQPRGRQPIVEPAYDGYDKFGGIKATDWLVNNNLPKAIADKLSDEARFHAGLALMHGCGHYHIDTRTGAKACIFHHGPEIIDPTITYYPIKYNERLNNRDPRSINDLVAAGILVRHPIVPTVPLKLSFRSDAVYEYLRPSRSSPG